MPDQIWIDRDDELPALAQDLSARECVGVDTEFLREKTFFPKLCLLQIAAGAEIFCVDAMRCRLDLLPPLFTAGSARKIVHAARQDLEAIYFATRRVMTPIFDTQIAAGCAGLKPQIGYAELAGTLLGVRLTKEHTRTDWSRRPLTPEQLEYAADDVRYLGDIADLLKGRLRELGREAWVAEDCAALEDTRLYEPHPAAAGERLRGLAQLDPAPRARARAIAAWRERLARDRNLPRSWVLADAAIFDVAQANPASPSALYEVRGIPPSFNRQFAESLIEVLREESLTDVADSAPRQDARPTDAQKALLNRLIGVVDAHAAQLGLSAEILAPRGELKALAMGNRAVHALEGWRRAEIGGLLLSNLD